MATDHLAVTPLLDFEDPRIRALIDERGWRMLSEFDRIGAGYGFVRNEIAFGFSASDDLPASMVLTDGYGTCNTKATLLMALLRATGIPCRIHGATVDKRLQRGIMRGLFYRVAPRDILHSWVEVLYEGRWVQLEGVILDDRFLDGVRATAGASDGPLMGWAVATPDVGHPPVQWHGTDTRIQADAVNHDLGVFADPDSFYAVHRVNERGVKGWVFRHWQRRVMNGRVAALRAATPDRAAAESRPVGGRGR